MSTMHNAPMWFVAGSHCSVITASIEAAAVLTLLSHPIARRHKALAPSLLLFALLELCQSVLWAKAVEGTCGELSASLVRFCSACLAAQPLAVAFYAHDRRRHDPTEMVPPTRLLMELSAAYLVGSVATAGGGASVQGLLAGLFPFAPDAPGLPRRPQPESCAPVDVGPCPRP